jgi:anthranilate synthase/aminodeoxychorismate synthase-like glutamine amidotransferase
MWALIDNYDSFTHILHHYLLQLHTDVRVFRNDDLTVEALAALDPERIIISPGPGRPLQAGITNEVIRQFHTTTPILGICLGHQALGEFYGATLVKADRPVHGSTTAVEHKHDDLFAGVPNMFQAMRYHSLILRNWGALPLKPLAFTEKRELMAFRHEHYPSVGIQFHPESILTEQGMQMLANWSAMFQP